MMEKSPITWCWKKNQLSFCVWYVRVNSCCLLLWDAGASSTFHDEGVFNPMITDHKRSIRIRYTFFFKLQRSKNLQGMNAFLSLSSYLRSARTLKDFQRSLPWFLYIFKVLLKHIKSKMISQISQDPLKHFVIFQDPTEYLIIF